MSELGLIHAFLLNGSGGAKSISLEEASHWTPEDGIVWLHFDCTASQTIQWISNDDRLDEVSQEALLSEETRPRVMTINDALLLSLRGVNLNPGSDHEDMVALRLWADQHRVITTVRRKLFSVVDIANNFEKNEGPINSSEFIIDLAERLIERMSGTINNIEDRLADLEEKVLDIGSIEYRQQLADVRRESIIFRRYLAPQREAMARLYGEKISWLDEKDRFRLREVTDQLIRYIEDLDSIRDRATVIHEELVSNLSEQMNKRMYVLSLAAAIFLPLSFLTGLFGINVGGIPGSESKVAFALFVLVLVVISIALLFLFKKKKWM
ncbi:MAG: zinc transporter ZntB [Deltaproteobacteria bacterium]|nr:zinc transporter ZntB [Deltaproteobacteria bacterium]MBT8356441.1 zinc transporter ZntB [Deltaproteobacteria bacterium]NNL41866.1 zinc transporter ZntB [Desulfobacterales bacterium]